MWGDIAIAFLLAFITAFVITPYSIRLAKKVGAVDYPNDRRVNKKPMPRLGGIAVIAGFLVSAIYLIITMRIENNIDFITDGLGKKLLGFLFGAMVLGITCYIDDVKGISPLVKLAGQLIAAIIVVSCGVRIDNFTIPFKENSIMINEVISYILTIGWIVGITNAINLIDGLDGLSSGITLIACISMLIIFSLNESPLIAIILITALAGAIVGFLPYNFNGIIPKTTKNTNQTKKQKKKKTNKNKQKKQKHKLYGLCNFNNINIRSRKNIHSNCNYCSNNSTCTSNIRYFMGYCKKNCKNKVNKRSI